MSKANYVAARVPKELHEQLQKLAAERYTNISQIVRDALRIYLEKEDPR